MGKLSSSNHGMNLYQGRKNAIINGNFNIWQRGASFTGVSNNDYNTDRFHYQKSGTMVHDIIQDTDVPSSVNANYSLKIDCTTADAAIAAGDYCFINQRIEGYNFLPFVGKTATLSFWVKATKPGIYCISFGNTGHDRSYVAEYTINSANTWEKKTITLTFDYSGGTWDYTNGLGLIITWSIVFGSTYQTTPGVWQSGNYYATSNQVNGTDNTDNNFWLSQVQFELGAEATEFEHLPIDQEIAMCQRYFEKSVGLTGKALSTADGSFAICIGCSYKSQKREIPTTVIKDYSDNINSISPFSSSGAIAITGTIGYENDLSYLTGTFSSSILYWFSWTADAEL